MKTIYRHSKSLSKEFSGIQRLIQREKTKRKEVEERVVILENTKKKEDEENSSIPEQGIKLRLVPQSNGKKHLHIIINGISKPLYASGNILFTED